MGFWHDHGVIDFDVCSEREHDSDVKDFGSRVDSAEHLFYTLRKNKCSAFFATRKE